MPIEFDPAWEYWDGGDLEIAEILRETAEEWFDSGFRLGVGDPDRYLPDRLGRRKQERTIPQVEYAICDGCKKRYEVRRHGTKRQYCSSLCANKCTALKRPRKTPDRMKKCLSCGQIFKATRSARNYCSLSCSSASPRRRKLTGKEEQFRALWMDGTPKPDIERALGISEKTVKLWRDKLNLPPRKPGNCWDYRKRKASCDVDASYAEKTDPIPTPLPDMG